MRGDRIGGGGGQQCLEDATHAHSHQGGGVGGRNCLELGLVVLSLITCIVSCRVYLCSHVSHNVLCCTVPYIPHIYHIHAMRRPERLCSSRGLRWRSCWNGACICWHISNISAVRNRRGGRRMQEGEHFTPHLTLVKRSGACEYYTRSTMLL